MPKVGGKEYKYTPEGRAKAKAAAKSKGVSVEYEEGGIVEDYEGGGEALGGQGGIDDIPALLTEGEVVLNQQQQDAISAITGRNSNELFAEAGVPGFEEYSKGGKVESNKSFNFPEKHSRD